MMVLGGWDISRRSVFGGVDLVVDDGGKVGCLGGLGGLLF